jgi:hypothetical protein
MVKRQPMATFNKGSKRYKEMRKQLLEQRISKAKEVFAVIVLVFICSVDLEPLLDMLLK